MIRVIWTPILQQYSNGEVIRYRINYGIAGSILNSLFVAPDKTQVDISNLKVGELYTVEVLAATSGGFSQPEVLTITIGDPKITSKAFENIEKVVEFSQGRKEGREASCLNICG